MKKTYFLADAHLGSLAIPHGRMHERRLVNFLESIRHDAECIYLLGDMFDFWYEYKTVVPRGYTRFLGKLSELTDSGIEVHYFIGNHDLWLTDYLSEECGVVIHNSPLVTEIHDKVFYISHGDGLGDRDWKFNFLRRLFHSRTARCLFSCLHPRWSMAFGRNWAKHSRLKRIDGQEPPYMGEEREPLVLFAKNYLRTHAAINYFVFGHRHIELDIMLSRTTRLAILGDWISLFTYATFDGQDLTLHNFEEGV